MTIWVDAQLSPGIARWLRDAWNIEARSVRDLGLRDASDPAIFRAARLADAVVMTKDSDFVQLVQQHGAPPRIIWLTCGNTSNAYLRQLLGRTLATALSLLATGEPLVEISDHL